LSVVWQIQLCKERSSSDVDEPDNDDCSTAHGAANAGASLRFQLAVLEVLRQIQHSTNSGRGDEVDKYRCRAETRISGRGKCRQKQNEKEMQKVRKKKAVETKGNVEKTKKSERNADITRCRGKETQSLAVHPGSA
jgi:hypothetical protein